MNLTEFHMNSLIVSYEASYDDKRVFSFCQTLPLGHIGGIDHASIDGLGGSDKNAGFLKKIAKFLVLNSQCVV